MSKPLVVSIPHSLGRDEAMRRLKTGLSRAASSVPVLSVDEERWEDNRMIFRVRALGQAAAGHVDVAEDHVQVEVDGGPAVLVDLSTTGAQLLSPTALKPNRAVKVVLPVDGNPVLCKGKVVWARLQPATKVRPLA